MADCASLERMCGGNSTEGSNPSLSAICEANAWGSNKGREAVRRSEAEMATGMSNPSLRHF